MYKGFQAKNRFFIYGLLFYRGLQFIKKLNIKTYDLLKNLLY